MPDLDQTLNKFMATTSRTKVAVIVPLYGYWKNILDNPLNAETLKITADRIGTSNHQLYIFFVGVTKLISDEVAQYLMGKMHGGNCYGVEVEANATYADYVREGMRVAHDTPDIDAAFFITLNPWTLIQYNGIDILVDRLNMGDNAKIISGFDLHETITNEDFDPQAFESFFVSAPREERDINNNLWGTTRYALEMIALDPNIKTSHYLKWDMAQQMYQKGYDVITSQRVPIFVFDIDLQDIEQQSDVEADKNYYISKWGFSPK